MLRVDRVFRASALPRNFRLFSQCRILRSQVDPADPDDPAPYKVKRAGTFFKEPMDPNTYLGQHPLYEGPFTSQIAFSKRWSMGFLFVGSYVGYLSMGVVGISDSMAMLGLLPLVLPLPLLQYFAGNYVTRVFRVYRKNEVQTYENLTNDETLMVEKLSLFGRSTYGVPIKVKDTYIVNKRLGWINWAYVDPNNNAMVKMYVQDNIGGMRMDRIWGILEKNSGIDNGRTFLIGDGQENSDSSSKPQR